MTLFLGLNKELQVEDYRKFEMGGEGEGKDEVWTRLTTPFGSTSEETMVTLKVWYTSLGVGSE